MPLIITIMGPTTAGKSAAALFIAQRIPSEIISVDSGLIYKNMNIGTAKPSITERANVPHHLIDILDPSKSYSAMQFRLDSVKLIQEIYARGKLPLLVGGTMLYFNVLKNGLHNLPTAHPTIRKKLNIDTEKMGIAALYSQLIELDPGIAARIKNNDKQRIQRALEIITVTGQPMSTLLKKKCINKLPFDILQLTLEPTVRDVLNTRIVRRFNIMLENNNLLNEVYRLRLRNDLHLNLPSMRCVGYRQVWKYFDGVYNYTEMCERCIIATRQLAKRQLTWLRAIPNRIIVDCNASNAKEILLDKIYKELICQNTDLTKNFLKFS